MLLVLVSHLSFSITFVIPIAVGWVSFHDLTKFNTPTGGYNPILIILGGHSFDFLLSLISGCVVIILQPIL